MHFFVMCLYDSSATEVEAFALYLKYSKCIKFQMGECQYKEVADLHFLNSAVRIILCFLKRIG